MSELEVARSLQFLDLYICQQSYSTHIVPALGRLKTEGVVSLRLAWAADRDLAPEETNIQKK